MPVNPDSPRSKSFPIHVASLAHWLEDIVWFEVAVERQNGTADTGRAVDRILRHLDLGEFVEHPDEWDDVHVQLSIVRPKRWFYRG